MGDDTVGRVEEARRSSSADAAQISSASQYGEQRACGAAKAAARIRGNRDTFGVENSATSSSSSAAAVSKRCPPGCSSRRPPRLCAVDKDCMRCPNPLSQLDVNFELAVLLGVRLQHAGPRAHVPRQPRAEPGRPAPDCAECTILLHL